MEHTYDVSRMRPEVLERAVKLREELLQLEASAEALAARKRVLVRQLAVVDEDTRDIDGKLYAARKQFFVLSEKVSHSSQFFCFQAFALLALRMRARSVHAPWRK